MIPFARAGWKAPRFIVATAGSPRFRTKSAGKPRTKPKRDASSSSKSMVPPANATRHSYEQFRLLVEKRFNGVMDQVGSWQQSPGEYQSFGISSQPQLDREIGLFKKTITKAFSMATEHGLTDRRVNPLFWSLRSAFVRGDAAGLSRELRYAFQTFMLRARFPASVNELHLELADMRFPHEWYPATRAMQRTIHLHVGPTNSGKTYNALKALENAKSGIYAGPLRLLAHEVYSRFTAKGVACALITGEEQRIPSESDRYFSSCTVEMSPLNQRVDVAIIDEIQMIADIERGWAWTHAFLGIQAKELHLCGEERAVPLIQQMCARLGEKCIIHSYQRLNPLQTMSQSLRGDFKQLQKGDAIVSFSRYNLHVLKRGIEEATGRRCAIVYGSLPPETRANQAALFNDPDNDFDFLVASDAIGMGLNLEIRRIIFDSSVKFDGAAQRRLTVSEIKQIGGRAGRFRTANQDIRKAKSDEVSTDAPVSSTASPSPVPGFVTAFVNEDMSTIRKGMASEARPITMAGLTAPASIFERFHSYFPPRTPSSFVLARLREMARVSDRFMFCDITQSLDIAEAIKHLDMSISDRCVFLSAPADLRTPGALEVLQAFATCVAQNKAAELVDIKELDLEVLEISQLSARGMPNFLLRLEALHKAVTLYLWLTYRFQGVFVNQNLAFKVKELVENRISEHLDHLNFVPEMLEERRRKSRKIASVHEKKERELLGKWDQDEQVSHPAHNEAEVVEPVVEDQDELETLVQNPPVVPPEATQHRQEQRHEHQKRLGIATG